ncbi:glycosyl hydrolase [Alteromonas sediminis]|uniref:Endo-1,3-beta-glucanase btgC n=2 Tax=Alteromonas sediminis TaxID=2259342 RepID=A0A3N5YDJ2_9ALTE|nr:glycosyl hydrolase [Alteromonas sediminis]
MNPYKKRRGHVFAGTDNPRERIKEIMQQKLHGLCFSPYLEGQGPGSALTDEQISSRLAVISNHCRWVRTFSCTQGNERIPALAKDQGLKTLVGVWLDEDLENNDIEIEKGIELAKRGDVNLLAVGNEVLLREELTPEQLIDYIQRVKKAVPHIPVGYVDAYYLFEDFPQVADVCDVLFANCYPFWEGYSIEHAHIYMRDMYYRAKAIAGERPVIISETGWPNKGSLEGQAQPSEEFAMRYFIQACEWTEQNNIDLFYFSAFDEAWKVDAEGDVGAYWGLWDKDGETKFWDE